MPVVDTKKPSINVSSIFFSCDTLDRRPAHRGAGKNTRHLGRCRGKGRLKRGLREGHHTRLIDTDTDVS